MPVFVERMTAELAKMAKMAEVPPPTLVRGMSLAKATTTARLMTRTMGIICKGLSVRAADPRVESQTPSPLGSSCVDDRYGTELRRGGNHACYEWIHDCKNITYTAKLAGTRNVGGACGCTDDAAPIRMHILAE